MNSYPSWIHRIPEMIESLALLDREWMDRELVESIFDLRKTAAFHLLRRMGAQRCGNSLLIGRGRLMARLREAQENHDWRWEAESRRSVQQRIESLETQRRRKSLVPVDAALAKHMAELRTAGLPNTIQLAAGLLTIRCNGIEDLLRQLVLLAKMADTDFAGLRLLIEAPAPRRSPASETRTANLDSSQSA
jgi:hypothetical protein